MLDGGHSVMIVVVLRDVNAKKKKKISILFDI
jgi:hypothetical protein